MFLFVSRMNFKCLIKVILDCLLRSVKSCLKTSESELDRLAVWQSTVYVMEKIVQSIKKQDSRNNLLIFVKVMIYITNCVDQKLLESLCIFIYRVLCYC